MEPLKEFNVVVTGVGGQGTLLLSRLIAAAARREGFVVQTGETLGMAQRGGSVVSFVRYGEKVFTPIVPDHKADLLISLEPVEALRSIRYVRSATRILLNTRPKPPLSIILGEAKYPDVKEIEAVLKSVGAETFAFDAAKLAETAGDARAANVSMLGGMAALRESSIKVENFREALKEVLPERLIQVNMQAFKLGYDTVVQVRTTSEFKNPNSSF